MNTTSSKRNGERLLEIGWFVVDKLDARNLELIALARERVRARVTEIFPQFDGKRNGRLSTVLMISRRTEYGTAVDVKKARILVLLRFSGLNRTALDF